MGCGSRPKNHHWWPIGLQTYWADAEGDVAWVGPDGASGQKKFYNKKIGYKKHGHTLFRGGEWGETNFECEFDIDNEVHRIIEKLNNLRPSKSAPSAVQSLLNSISKRDRTLAETCAIHHMEEHASRDLLLLVYSLLIRSPSNRWKWENFPAQFGLPVSESVGKANMRQSYLLAKRLCQKGGITNRFFVVLHSDHKRFVCGDGYLDWLSGSLQINRVSGRALIPLTPNLCVYVCTPISMRTNRNCAALRAPPWMVNKVNEITQIYSRDQLFFLGNKPRLTEHFLKREFLEHSNYRVDLLDQLDEIAQPKSRWMI